MTFSKTCRNRYHDQKLLLDTLDDFASKNSVADLWLRDDDATQPSPALDRLLGLSARYAVPMTLAVIPEPTGDALAKRLETTSGIDVAVHGWAHRNHARPEEKKRELGLHRPLEIVLDELRTGLTKLQSLHGPRFVPMLVPPWNRIDQTVIEHLPQARYRALSVYGPEKPDSSPSTPMSMSSTGAAPVVARTKTCCLPRQQNAYDRPMRQAA